MKNQGNNKSGFTMLEILIVILILGIVTGSIMEIFGTNYRSYILQDDVAAMQENLRTAMSYLKRDIQMAGSGIIGADTVDPSGVVDPDTIGFQGIIQKSSATEYSLNSPDVDFCNKNVPYTVLRAYPIIFCNGQGNETDRKKGTDKLRIRYVKSPDTADLNTGVDGTCGTSANACDKLWQLPVTGFASGQISVTALDTALSQWNLNNCTCNSITSTNYAIISGCFDVQCTRMSSDVVKVTGSVVLPADTPKPGDTGYTPQTLTGTLNIDPATPVKNTYSQGTATISFFNPKNFITVDYFLTDDGILRMDKNDMAGAQPLAENIEDLQFAFILADGTVINNANLTPTQSLQIRSVRINLLGRTARPNNTFNTGVGNAIRLATGQASGAIEDHNVSDIEASLPPPQDGRFYVFKLIQMTVGIRGMW